MVFAILLTTVPTLRLRCSLPHRSARDPLTRMNRGKAGSSQGCTSRTPVGFKCGGGEVELGLIVRRGLAPSCSCPPVSLKGVTVCVWGRRRGHCVFSRQRRSQSCWQETAGTVGRGWLVTVPPRPISHQRVGARQLGGPRRDDLGEAGREQN